MVKGSLEFGSKGLREILKDLEPVFISSVYPSTQCASALPLALPSIWGLLSVDGAGCGRGDLEGLGVQRLYNDFISSSFTRTCCPEGGRRAMLLSGQLPAHHWPPLFNYTREASASVC